MPLSGGSTRPFPWARVRAIRAQLGLSRLIEQLGQADDALTLRAQLQDLLLHVRARSRPAPRASRRGSRRPTRAPRPPPPPRRRPGGRLPGPRSISSAVGASLSVVDVRDAGGEERAPLRLGDDTETLSAFDEDVEAPVVEALEHLDHRRGRPDLGASRRRRQARGRIARARRDIRRSARGSGVRRCGAVPARPEGAPCRAETGRSRPLGTG